MKTEAEGKGVEVIQYSFSILLIHVHRLFSLLRALMSPWKSGGRNDWDGTRSTLGQTRMTGLLWTTLPDPKIQTWLPYQVVKVSRPR